MKKTKLILILGMILLASVGFIIFDILNHNFSLILKGLIVLMSTILVFLINNDGLDKIDSKLLELVFILIILADLSLLFFKDPNLGIGIFFLVQCGLIYRTYRYISIISSLKEIFNYYNLIILLTLITMLIIYLLLIINYIEDKVLFIIFTFYGLIKSASVFMAILNYRLKLFPRLNSKLFLIGQTCFYLCDICVGLTLTLNASFISKLFGILIWVFYTPALTLIGLSGYDYSTFE